MVSGPHFPFSRKMQTAPEYLLCNHAGFPDPFMPWLAATGIAVVVVLRSTESIMYLY